MFWRRKKIRVDRQQKQQHTLIEGLESRRLLSAAADAVMHPYVQFLHDAATPSADIQGYIPSDIRQAYGFDQVKLGNGSVAADGRGQTIAIVDAFNDPNIVNDLNVFDQQFGIAAPPSFRVVNQNGGSKLPTTDPGWAGEISLDVEWAHAMAPGANILLVEANSDTVNDLMAAVKYARGAPGVSVVSMSWGGSEFFSWGGGEFASQTNLDPFFTTPAGHQGVTFVAAAGDSGAASGVQWPASSPNVLSVGGTSLYVDQSGNYLTEYSWNGTSGGFSQVENEPAYQQNVQNTGARTTPDVAFAGDPNTGFAVYDSLPDQGYSGWQEVGGTSAGAPQWAALIAIVNQGRALNGASSLDGATQTLPDLYSLYSDPTSGSSSSSYASDFNDVTSGGGGGRWHWRWGGWGGSVYNASTGYDVATGLGTPRAADLVTALIGSSTSGSASSSGSGVGSGSGSSGGSGNVTQQLPASPVTGTVLSAQPVSVLGGNSGSIKLRLTNTGDTRFTGPISITLYASTGDTVSTDDPAITSMTLANVNLKASGSKILRLKFHYPTDLTDGSYHLIASIDATATNTAPAEAVAPAAVRIGSPNVDLGATFAGDQTVVVHPAKGSTATIVITNLGNVTATGNLSVNLYASVDQTLDSSDQFLTTLPNVRVKLKPGASKTLRIHFVAPPDAAGSYDLIASINSSTQVTDSNSANDVAVAGTI